MLLNDFRFANSFFGLTDAQLQLELDEVEIAWSGIRTMWSKIREPIRTQKIELCLNYISAWYIADLHPLSVTGGVFASGGSPIVSKSFDGLSVTYAGRKVPSGMEQLTSNAFGLKALDMIVNCPDMLSIHG